MAQSPGPWDHPHTTPLPPAPPAQPPNAVRLQRRSPWALAAVIGLGGLAVLALTRLFPGRLNGPDSWGELLWGGGLLALVGARLAAMRIGLGQAARNILLWLGLAAVLAAGYAYRDELGQAWLRIRSGLAPAYAATSGAHELLLSQDADGQYYAVGRVDGQPVTFMLDTGASDIVLSPADAQRLGIDLAALHFDAPYETANGVGYGARYRAGSLAVGPIRFDDVAISINQRPMRTSLLGMAFFRRLQSYSFEGRRLVLKWR